MSQVWHFGNCTHTCATPYSLAFQKIEHNAESFNLSKKIDEILFPTGERIVQYLANHSTGESNSFRFEFPDPKYIRNQPDILFSNPATPLIRQV
jgi:hypothetical protein